MRLEFTWKTHRVKQSCVLTLSVQIIQNHSSDSQGQAESEECQMWACIAWLRWIIYRSFLPALLHLLPCFSHSISPVLGGAKNTLRVNQYNPRWLCLSCLSSLLLPPPYFYFFCCVWSKPCSSFILPTMLVSFSFYLFFFGHVCSTGISVQFTFNIASIHDQWLYFLSKTRTCSKKSPSQ